MQLYAPIVFVTQKHYAKILMKSPSRMGKSWSLIVHRMTKMVEQLMLEDVRRCVRYFKYR